MRHIRSGNGVGDNIYLESIVRWFQAQGDQMVVHTRYKDIFKMHQGLQIEPFSRQGIDTLAHYTSRKEVPGTSQFTDMCIRAGIAQTVNVPLSLQWRVQNQPLVDALKADADGRPILCVQMPRPPMDRDDGFGMDIMPNLRIIDKILDRYKDKFHIIQIGQGEPLHKFSVHHDYANTTSLTDLIDIATVCDFFIGQCSFIIPLSEALGKRCLILFAEKGFHSKTDFLRSITPAKVLHYKDRSHHLIDSWDMDTIWKATEAFFEPAFSHA